jgi:SAM-dependent methyltransferase
VSRTHETEFDRFADDYDRHLQKGLSLAGETKEHFAEQRVTWTARRLGELQHVVRSAFDYGCGTGTSVPLLRDTFSLTSVVGVDVSQKSLDLAPRGKGISYGLVADVEPRGEHDLGFTTGVFHHISYDERAAAVDYLRNSLRPGGVIAFWENNPFNPAMRYGMRMNEFDRDALHVRPTTARRLLTDGGFRVLRTDHLFIFPHALRSLRWIEPRVVGLPIGAQYLVLAQRN